MRYAILAQNESSNEGFKPIVQRGPLGTPSLTTRGGVLIQTFLAAKLAQQAKLSVLLDSKAFPTNP